jgi:hypothetical protein
MKRRSPPKFIAEKLHLRRTAAPPAPTAPRRPLPLDGSIRALRNGDPNPKEQERLGRLSATERWEDAYSWQEKRLLQANDPNVLRQAARVNVGHTMVASTMANLVAVEGELPHLRVYPHRDPRNEHWGLLKQAWGRLFPNTRSGVSDPRGHGPSAKWSWSTFIRKLRGG